MKVSELKAGQGKVDIELTVKTKEPERVFNKYGKELKVANAMAADDSGDQIKLSLWNDEIGKINVGDKVKISNGYVSEFNGEKQLSAGKFGKLEVVGAGSSSSEDSSKETKPKKAKAVPPSDLEEVEF